VFAKGYLMVSKGLYYVGDRLTVDGFINLLSFLYFKVVRFLWMKLDIMVVDLLINGVAKFAFKTGKRIRSLQTGFLNNYVLFLLIGIIFILGVITYSLR
jgi:NADH-quinone oxidoreductase subunit L